MSAALDRAEATPFRALKAPSGRSFRPTVRGSDSGPATRSRRCRLREGRPPRSPRCRHAPLGASWGEDGTIFFESAPRISRVSSAGGTPAAVTTADAAKERASSAAARAARREGPPVHGRDVRRLGYGERHPASLDTGEQRVLIPGGADARYVEHGPHRLHESRHVDGRALRRAIAAGDRRAGALIEGVMQGVNAPNGDDETGAGQFTVSTSGTLLYVVGGISPIRKARGCGSIRKGAAQPLRGRADRPVSVSASLAGWAEDRGGCQTRSEP